MDKQELIALAEKLTPPMRKVLAQLNGPTFWTTDPMPWEGMGLGRQTDALSAHDKADGRTFYRYRLNRAGLALRAIASQEGK